MGRKNLFGMSNSIRVSRRDALAACCLTAPWSDTGQGPDPAVSCWEAVRDLLQPVRLMKHASGAFKGRLEGNKMMREQHYFSIQTLIFERRPNSC